MTSGGHNKKPERLHVLAGTDRPSRRKNTPKPNPVAPERPAWLTGEAAAAWERLSPELGRLGLLTHLDAAALAAYCSAWASWRWAQAEIERDGAVIAGHRGVLRKHPAWTIGRQAQGAMMAIGRDFGLTPLARQRLDVATVKEESECSRCGLPDSGPNAMCGCH